MQCNHRNQKHLHHHRKTTSTYTYCVVLNVKVVTSYFDSNFSLFFFSLVIVNVVLIKDITIVHQRGSFYLERSVSKRERECRYSPSPCLRNRPWSVTRYPSSSSSGSASVRRTTNCCGGGRTRAPIPSRRREPPSTWRRRRSLFSLPSWIWSRKHCIVTAFQFKHNTTLQNKPNKMIK